jgi:hypothetical protein
MSGMTGMLAVLRAEEIRREARGSRIVLGPFQDEEQELLALDREHRIIRETTSLACEPIAAR